MNQDTWYAARQWLTQHWWGSLTAYLILVTGFYLALWALIEPLSVPEQLTSLPSFLSQRWVLHVALSLLFGAHATILLDLWQRKAWWGSRQTLVHIPARDEYLDACVAAIDDAKTHVLLFTSKIHRSTEREEARRVNAALAAATDRGVAVRILVALDETRLPGAVEVSGSGFGAVRFDPTLHLADLNFYCVDDRSAIIATRLQAQPSQYVTSQDWYRANSTTLGRSLAHHFDGRWSQYGTLTLPQLMRLTIPRNVTAHGVDHVGRVLGIRRQVVEAYSRAIPYYILLAGRPGSGKSTVASIFVERLRRGGVSAVHLSDLPFFRELFSLTEDGAGFLHSVHPETGKLLWDTGKGWAFGVAFSFGECRLIVGDYKIYHSTERSVPNAPALPSAAAAP